MASVATPTDEPASLVIERLSPTRFELTFKLTLAEMVKYGYVLDSGDMTELLRAHQDAGSLNYGEIDVPEREPRMTDKVWAKRQETSDPRYTGFAFELEYVKGTANTRTWALRGTLSLRGARGEFVNKMLTEGTPFRLRPRLVRGRAGKLYIYTWDMVDAE